jgi:phage terminase large subunit-like protein
VSNEKERYKRLIGCIGDTIAITRCIAGKKKTAFNNFLLKKGFGSSDVWRQADRIEAGIQKIDFGQFSKICSYLGVDASRVLDLAVLVKKEKKAVAKNRLTTSGDAFIHRLIVSKRIKVETTLYGELVKAG